MKSSWVRRGVASLASLALVASFVALGAGRADALDACNGNWDPVLRDVTINQGLGTYSPLARNKTTLVRFFITAPSCAPANSEQLMSATVSATEPLSTTPLANAVPTSPAKLGPTYPTINAYSAWPVTDSPSFPTFVLNNFGQNDTNNQQLTATFTASVTYQYQAVAGGAWASKTITVSKMPGSLTTNITATIAPAANAVRVLVVPMGNASDNMCNQFPESRLGCTNSINSQFADTVVQNAMTTFSRLLPVPGGVGDLNGNGGLLYHLADQNVGIDLGPNGLNDMTYGDGTQLCLSGSNFTAPSTAPSQPSIASKLAAFLQSWNSANPSTMHADRVLGVVWQPKSLGSNSGCAEGMATLPTSTSTSNGDAAAIRLIPDQLVTNSNGTTTPAPSVSGGLVGMEINHTWGGVPLLDPRDTAQDYHSGNTSADPTGTNRAYNTALAQWISSPRSAMRYSGNTSFNTVSGWNNNTVVFETQDYSFDQCVLSSTVTNSSCNYGAVGGSATSSAAGPSIGIAGTTDGTKNGTYLESYYTTTEQTNEDSVSTYRMLEFDSNHIQLKDYGLPVHTNGSSHDVVGPDDTSFGTGTIDSALPTATGTASFEIWNGEPPLGTFLYSAAVGPVPVLSASSGGASISNVKDFTNKSGDETRPALSNDGLTMAWVGSGGIFVQRRNPSTNLPTGPVNAVPLLGTDPGALNPNAQTIATTDPAWNGSQLAFATSKGDVESVTVTADGTNAPSFSAPTVLYNHLIQTPPAVGTTTAAHPSYSPDATKLAIAVNGNIYVITPGSNVVYCDLSSTPVANPTCSRLAGDGTDSGPAWGATNRVGYEHLNEVDVVDPSAPGTLVGHINNASAPSWGSNLLAFTPKAGTQSGQVWVANTSGGTASDGTFIQTAQLTSGCADATPTLSGDASAVAFDRSSSAGCATTTQGHDIMDGSLTTMSSQITFSYTTPGDARNLKADLFDTVHPGDPVKQVNDPIFAAVPPTSVSTDGHTANWVLNYDTNRGAPGSVVQVRATDGFNLSLLSTIETIPGSGPGAPPTGPGAAIGNPTNGSVYLQYDAVLATGSSVEPTDGTNSGVQTQFYLSGPSGSGYTGYPNSPVGAANQTNVEIDPNTPGGWVPGTYTLTYRVTTTGATPHTDVASVTFKVLPDPAHAGVNVSVAFNPQTLYVPSSGQDVTVTVTPNGQDLSKVSKSSVYITEVGGFSASIPVDGSNGWASVGGGVYQAKFSRQVLTCFMNQHGLNGGYVPVVVTGTASTFSIRGYDKTYPNVTPASTPITC